MPKRYRRMDRVDELLKEEIATILRDLKDPRVGFVTVMDVETSPDLRHARVHVSVLGDEDEKAETMAALERAAGYVRGRVGRAVTLKYLPELSFHLDRTIDRAARIDTLIEEMRADVGDAPEGTAGEDPGGEHPGGEHPSGADADGPAGPPAGDAPGDGEDEGR